MLSDNITEQLENISTRSSYPLEHRVLGLSGAYCRLGEEHSSGLCETLPLYTDVGTVQVTADILGSMTSNKENSACNTQNTHSFSAIDPKQGLSTAAHCI